MHERADDFDVNAVLEPLSQKRDQIVATSQADVVGDVDAGTGQAQQFGPIGVIERIRIEHAIGNLRPSPALGRRLSKVFEEKTVAAADGTTGRVEDAAGVTHGIVVRGGALVGRLGHDDELVPRADDGSIRAATDGTRLEHPPLGALRVGRGRGPFEGLPFDGRIIRWRLRKGSP